MALLVTGTIGIDTIHTPAAQATEVLGGSCTYFAAAASFFGPVRMVAAVGDDFPAAHKATLAKFPNIDTAGLEVRKGSKTFRWGGKYLNNMNSRETLFTELGVLGEASPTVPEAFKNSNYIFLANMHPGAQAGLLAQCAKPKLSVADTMDLWINIARPDLESLLGKVDGLVLNHDEAELFTGKTNTVTAGRHILNHGPRFVVIKKGEHGALLIHRDGYAALPAYPTENVVDPTGAGDSFAGGLMAALSRMNPEDPGSFSSIRKAMAYGTVIASFNIEEFSLNRFSRLTYREVEQRFDEYCEMTRI